MNPSVGGSVQEDRNFPEPKPVSRRSPDARTRAAAVVCFALAVLIFYLGGVYVGLGWAMICLLALLVLSPRWSWIFILALGVVSVLVLWAGA